MKIQPKIALLLLSFLFLIPAPTSACDTDVSKWPRDQFMTAFDEIARNFGAAEYATYTYMYEFGHAPESLDDLRETGHLNVFMVNPYTGSDCGDVVSLVTEDYPDGDVVGNILITNNRNDGREAHLEAYYLRVDDGFVVLRSMIKRIALTESTMHYSLFFDNDLPRDEQMVSVYCTQAIDAIESFQQRNPDTPEDFIDMWNNGDVNVHYVNPITGELVANSEELSAGDYFYEQLGPEDYTLIGWGRDRPVFFATTSSIVEATFYNEWPELFDGAAE